MKQTKETKIRQKMPKRLRFSRLFLRRMLPFLLAAAVIDIRALLNLRNNIVAIDETNTSEWWTERIERYFEKEDGASESEADHLVKDYGFPYLVSRLANYAEPYTGVPSTTSEISVMLVRPEKFEYYISGAQVTLITHSREQDAAELKPQTYDAVQEEAEQIESDALIYGKKHIFGAYFSEMTTGSRPDPIIAVFEKVSSTLHLNQYIHFNGPAFESKEPIQAYINTEDQTFCGLKYAWVNEHSDRSRLVYTYDTAPGEDWKQISTPLYIEQKNGQYLYDRDARDRYYGTDSLPMAESPYGLIFFGYPANCLTGNHMREIGESMEHAFPEFKECEQTLKEINADESGTMRDRYYRGDYEKQLYSLKHWGFSISMYSDETETPTPEEMLETLYKSVGRLPEHEYIFNYSFGLQMRSYATKPFYCTNPVKLNGETCYLFVCGYDNNLKRALPHLVFMNLQILILALLVSLIWGTIAYLRKMRQYEMDEYRRSLTAALAHDLKSPMTAISGYAENLCSGVHPEKQAHYSESILQNTQYMDNIIKNVLDLAQLEKSSKARKKHVDPIALMQEMAAHRQDELDARTLNMEITGSCSFRADPIMMTQAIRNLLDNAVKFTPDGGSITVTGEGSSLRIVNDIAEDKVAHVEQLCEAFVKGDSARSNRKGTGLGLSVVRQIAELNKLRFSIESSNHKFTVLLRDKPRPFRRIHFKNMVHLKSSKKQHS